MFDSLIVIINMFFVSIIILVEENFEEVYNNILLYEFNRIIGFLYFRKSFRIYRIFLINRKISFGIYV